MLLYQYFTEHVMPLTALITKRNSVRDIGVEFMLLLKFRSRGG